MKQDPRSDTDRKSRVRYSALTLTVKLRSTEAAGMARVLPAFADRASLFPQWRLLLCVPGRSM